MISFKDLTELQQMLTIGISTGCVIILSIFFWGYRRHQSSHPTLGSIARLILLISTTKEIIGGIIHFLFPYDCNIHISGLAGGLGIQDDMNAMTGMALYAAGEGSTRIILSVISMIPFLMADHDLFLTMYVLTAHFLVRLMDELNMMYGVFNDVPSHLPSYMQNRMASGENAAKSPPGLHGLRIQVVLLAVGVVLCILARRQLPSAKKNN